MNFGKLLVIALFAASTVGCTININEVVTNGIPGSGIPATENREVAGFDEISIVGFGDVNILVGGEDSLTITGDDNLLAYIESTVENGVLTIQPSEPINPKTDMLFDITVSELSRVELSGSADFEIQELAGDSLDVELNGSSNLEANGAVTALDIEINGAGKLDFQQLDAEDVVIELNGAGKGVVTATNSVDAEINGVGMVTVYGNPASVNKQINGIGRLKVVQ